MKTNSGVWVPASEHARKQRGHVTDDEEYEDIEGEDELYGQDHDETLHHHHHHHQQRDHEEDADISPPRSRDNEGRQRMRGANGVRLNAGERDTVVRGEVTPPSLVAAHRAVTPAQEHN